MHKHGMVDYSQLQFDCSQKQVFSYSQVLTLISSAIHDFSVYVLMY